MEIVIISVYTFSLCIPFGYWRASTRRFSLAWIASIHLPVLLIIPVRRWWLHVSPWWLFLLVPLFFLGQRAGAALQRHWASRSRGYPVSHRDEHRRESTCPRTFMDRGKEIQDNSKRTSWQARQSGAATLDVASKERTEERPGKT